MLLHVGTGLLLCSVGYVWIVHRPTQQECNASLSTMWRQSYKRQRHEISENGIRYDARKHFYVERIVNMWNSLSANTRSCSRRWRSRRHVGWEPSCSYCPCPGDIVKCQKLVLRPLPSCVLVTSEFGTFLHDGRLFLKLSQLCIKCGSVISLRTTHIRSLRSTDDQPTVYENHDDEVKKIRARIVSVDWLCIHCLEVTATWPSGGRGRVLSCFHCFFTTDSWLHTMTVYAVAFFADTWAYMINSRGGPSRKI